MCAGGATFRRNALSRDCEAPAVEVRGVWIEKGGRDARLARPELASASILPISTPSIAAIGCETNLNRRVLGTQS